MTEQALSDEPLGGDRHGNGLSHGHSHGLVDESIKPDGRVSNPQMQWTRYPKPCVGLAHPELVDQADRELRQDYPGSETEQYPVRPI